MCIQFIGDTIAIPSGDFIANRLHGVRFSYTAAVALVDLSVAPLSEPSHHHIST